MASVELTNAALPAHADVVVIGGGLVGLATAFYASRAGLGDVVLLERNHALVSLTSEAAAAGFRLEWDAPENIEMVRRSVEVFRNFDEVAGIPGYSIDLHMSGYLFLSAATEDARRQARFEERVAWWHEHGLEDVELLDGDAARARWPFLGDDVEAAHFRQDEGYLNVYDVARGYLLGGDFRAFVNAGVHEIERSGSHVSGVRLASGERIAADAVVIAAGPFSAQLAATADVELRIRNKRRHALIVPLPSEIIDPSWPVVLDSELGLYWRPRRERHTTTGIYIGWERALPWDQDDSAPQDPVPVDYRYMEAVKQSGTRLMRHWDSIPFEDVIWRSGQYTSPETDDGRPIIGAHPDLDGLFVNTAYEGRGVMASPAGSELLVRLIESSDDTEAKPFSVRMDERPTQPDLMVL